MIKAINDGGRPWVVRLIFSGDPFGLDFKLVHDGEPVIEFYDARHEHTQYGQFVSRYYMSTLLEGYENGRTKTGICLQGNVPSWSVSGEALARILEWAKTAVTERQLNPPIDRKWLSKYIADMQTAWDLEDRSTVANMLFDSNFNDKIYYTS